MRYRLGMAEVVAVRVPHHLAEDTEALSALRELVHDWATPREGFVTIHALEETAGGAVLVMEPDPPCELRDVALAARAVLSPEGRVRWAAARAREAARALGALPGPMRDLSPRTLGFDADGRVRLLPPLARVTASHGRMGAGVVPRGLAWLSPELTRGTHVDRRSDVFQLATLTWTLCGVAPPFARGTDLDTLTAILEGPRPPPLSEAAGVPSTLDDAVARGLARDPAERHEDAAAFALALANVPDASADEQAEVAADALRRARARTRSAAGASDFASRLFDGPVARPCLKRWDDLAATARPAIRDCAECGLSVERVKTLGALVPLAGSCVFYDPEPEG